MLGDPAELLAPHVQAGKTVFEPGPRMGFFTLELGRRVGPQGRVVVPGVQPCMIAGLERRVVHAGLADRGKARLVAPSTPGVGDLSGVVDFALAHSVVHEMPDTARFFSEVATTLKPGGRILLFERSGT